MAGTVVFTDTIGATFDSRWPRPTRGRRLRPDAVGDRPRLRRARPAPRRLARRDRRFVDGVDGVAHQRLRPARRADGEPVGDIAKNPAFGTNWVTVDDLNPYELASGHAPGDDGEIVIDKASADKAGYQPGDVATVLTKSAPRQFTIAGIATFGTADSPPGRRRCCSPIRRPRSCWRRPARPMRSPSPAECVAGGCRRCDPGCGRWRRRGDHRRHARRRGPGIDGRLLAEFGRSSLVFALVAVFVGAFIINNTFSITVAQRTRRWRCCVRSVRPAAR